MSPLSALCPLYTTQHDAFPRLGISLSFPPIPAQRQSIRIPRSRNIETGRGDMAPRDNIRYTRTPSEGGGREKVWKAGFQAVSSFLIQYNRTNSHWSVYESVHGILQGGKYPLWLGGAYLHTYRPPSPPHNTLRTYWLVSTVFTLWYDGRSSLCLG